MIYGYARVSTAAQDETGQVRQLKAAGCEKVFREKITGTTADRPQLTKLMKALAPGDVVITPAVDRLSRDTTDLLVIAREMQRAGAGIRSLAEPYLDTTSDFAEIIFAILGVAAKLERRRILERTARGRADAKANGVKFGRKPILRRTSRRRPASASKRARRSVASRAATMSARARFHGFLFQERRMANEGIPVNGAIIAWGRARAGLTLEEATRKFRHFPKWESGERLPTYPQLEQLADALKLPIAVFFFPEPPTLPPIRESFRTLPDEDYEQMPREVRFMLRKAKALQLNLAELTGGRNPAERLILRDLVFSADTAPDEMAARVRAYVGVPLENQFAWPDDDTALKAWRKAIHDVGVFVFKDAFRAPGYCGFSLFDPVFPLIYVNNSTTKSRQIFTLFHELGHLLLHTSGIDTLSGSITHSMTVHQRRMEVLCNRFAAQFLVPDDVFRAELRGREHSPETAEYLAKRFNVSREVIYRKFLDRRWITPTEYERATAEWNTQRQSGGGDDGGNHYYTKLTYLGREYVGLVLREYHQNRIDGDQLADYLDTKPKNVATLEEYYLQGVT